MENISLLVGQITTLVETEISQQLFDGFDTDIHGPQRKNPADFGATSRLTFVVLSETPCQLSDVLP